MIELIFPKTYSRFSTLPLLGTHVEGFALWLSQHDYRPESIRLMLPHIEQIDPWLRAQGIQAMVQLDVNTLEKGWQHFYHRGGSRATCGAVIRALARYFIAEGILSPAPRLLLTPSAQLLAAYEAQLVNLRGFARSTITEHLRSAAQFLDHLDYNNQPTRLNTLAAGEIEAFVGASAARLSRGTQQHCIGHLRSFLRFLAANGQCPTGLDRTIDTPRLYRHEQLPRALPWDTVQALLASIDRSTALGLRDYTMLFLITSYGLRVSEIAALSLDDIHWRESWVHIRRGKTRSPLQLPLTESVGAALVQYLREARPQNIASRALFVRTRAPLRAVVPTTVSMAFERWAKRSGLTLPFYGAHCLRHSYALRLLQSGAALKTIGDLLGHRDSDSTYSYLRLETEALREVALSVPTRAVPSPAPEV